MSGIKHDNGKTDMGLLFREVPYALEEVGKALQMGSTKYGVGNWLKVEDGNSRYLSAMVRHLTAYYKGELIDKESGLSHLVHVATNAMFLADLEKRNNDDNCMGTGNLSSGQSNDSRAAIEERPLQEDIHAEGFHHPGAKGFGLCPSGRRLIPASSKSCSCGGFRCAVHFGK